MLVRGLSQQRYQLESKPFSSGGEGDVYGIVGSSNKVVKVYHQGLVTTELEEKLKIMVRRPPNSSILSQVAWPLDLVYDSYGYFCGFVMPRLSINAELNDIYGYPPRTNITYKQKLIIAQNICAVISEIHNAGYVFGDFNPNNIGINTTTGRVAFLDTDSYHITNGSKTYRCKVCLDGYVAPELIKQCESSGRDYANAPLPTFTKETDNFALAIHIFKLLMNGYTPFNGIKETQRASTASPGVGNQAIKRDQYCFKPGNKPMSPAVPPIDALPTEIADLFTRAFMDGRIDPKQRPSAYEWYKALENYEQSLVVCKKNSTHMYKRGLKRCPWCDADEAYKQALAPKPTPASSQKTFTAPVQYNPTSYSYTPPVSPPTQPSQTNGYSSSQSGQGGYTSQHTGNTRRKKRVGGSWLKLCILALVVFGIIKTGIIQAVINAFSNSSSKDQSIAVQKIDDPYAVGKTVLFGRFEQDGNESNGPEAIEWQILDKKGDKILLLSLYVLENKYYDERLMGLNHNVDWENSTLRKWIKESFYYSAFNSSERESIVLTTNDGSSDYVFLLSQEEVKQYLDAHSRKCTMTVAAEKTPGGGHYRDCVEWWLRITGGSTKYAPTVAATGIGGTVISGEDIYSSRYGVRPAIWIKAK